MAEDNHYMFYIDESFDQEIHVLVAYGFLYKHWFNTHQAVIRAKQRVFPEKDAWKLEIKSNWLRIKAERDKRAYLKKLTPDELKVLTDALYEVILENAFQKICLAAVLDVKTNQEQQRYPYEPELYTYKMLLSKVALFLKRNDATGILICDETKQSKLHIENLRNCNDFDGEWDEDLRQRIIENPLFVDSQYNNLIQLADLCAYNVFRVFKYNDPQYEYFQKIAPLIKNFGRAPRTESRLAIGVVGYSVAIQPKPIPGSETAKRFDKVIRFLC
ncbi:MAG: DUF3800 domain-containing protein [Candidatus Melainabacteria bacterium]|nr:DUF3800 domain-containing protein [Candidatus Melainabacteria bacterium]